jgi:hypothetical protein
MSPLARQIINTWIACGFALAVGCIDPVRSGYPPLVPCSGCIPPYVCSSNGGGCEILPCSPELSCPADAGLTCQKIGEGMQPNIGQCLGSDGGG